MCPARRERTTRWNRGIGSGKSETHRGRRPLPQEQGLVSLTFAQRGDQIPHQLALRRRQREEGIEITWRESGWHALAGEMRPGTIGGELLEREQQEALA